MNFSVYVMLVPKKAKLTEMINHENTGLFLFFTSKRLNQPQGAVTITVVRWKFKGNIQSFQQESTQSGVLSEGEKVPHVDFAHF